MTHRGKPVDPSQIRRVALMTVEGENDDISGVGQTEATHALCPANLPDHRRVHYVQKGVGHYGVFNGSRFPFRNRAAYPRFHDVGGQYHDVSGQYQANIGRCSRIAAQAASISDAADKLLNRFKHSSFRSN